MESIVSILIRSLEKAHNDVAQERLVFRAQPGDAMVAAPRTVRKGWQIQEVTWT